MTTQSVALDEADVLERVPRTLLLDHWRPAGHGDTFAVYDPATGEELASVADGTPQDAVEALHVAHEAGQAWRARTPRERSDVLRRAFELVIERTEEFALLITMEMGKTLAEARGEVRYGAEYLRWYSEEVVRLKGQSTPSPDGGSQILTSYEPVGLCVLITPWNFPLAMATRKIAPALAAGCSAVIKPATLAPLATLALGQVLLDAGLPEGVVTIITTTTPRTVIEPLLTHPLTRKVSFTGSTQVGAALLERGAPQLVRASMELGGNAPLIVFNDADLDVAVDGALIAKLRNNGESCIAANRILVQEGIADKFADRFAQAMGGKVVGRGTDPSVSVGPLIDQRAVEKTEELVRDAVDRGATLMVGGEPAVGPGTFYPPTVLNHVPSGARILSEEVFAPVAPLVRFETEAEAISLANATPFGLVSYLFTRDVDRAFRVNARLESGMVGINQGVVSNVAAPFGGIKHSGLGREGGVEGLLEYTNLKYTSLASRNP
jgi:succinate-semialdehyde dehydrogenase / glutarate-semialdehyde dehydrogenase